MEFLDPKKQKAYLIRLYTGYALVAIALILTTIILLYQAYGFGFTKNGQVIQNGLIYVSTRPGAADVYIDGQRYKDQTNTRILMPAGQYTFQLQREGYRTWQRAIAIEGGTVAHFDYPVLIPTKLSTTTVKAYDTAPGLVTTSPDRHWMMAQNSADFTTFDLYDLTKKTIAPTAIIIPRGIFTLGDGTSSWKLVEWSNDNRHVLMQHIVTKDDTVKSEYIMVDRNDVQSSFNLTTKLNSANAEITLRDKKYDRYYLFDKTAQTLSTASFDDVKPLLTLSHVLQFKSFGSDKILYATDQTAGTGKVAIKLLDRSQTYSIRQVSQSSIYMLDLATYSGDWYIAAGSSADGKTYVYKDPQDYLNNHPSSPLVPVQVLKVADSDFVSFSSNTRFVMVEHGQQIAVYDAENDKGYSYTLAAPIDESQPHVRWMDGHRLMYVSNGKMVITDFDNTNHQTLVASSPLYDLFFDRDYKLLYTFTSVTTKASDGTESSQMGLTSTPLLTTRDQ